MVLLSSVINLMAWFIGELCRCGGGLYPNDCHTILFFKTPFETKMKASLNFTS